MRAEELKLLFSYDDYIWYHVQLMQEPLYHLISTDKLKEIVDRAVRRGNEMAGRFADDITSKGAESWLQSRGFSVKENNKVQLPPFVMFAAVTMKARQIELFTDTIKKVHRAISEQHVWRNGIIPSESDLRNIILTHECYHVLEESAETVDKLGINYKVFFLKRTAVLKQSDEIAATVFCKEICNIDFNPCILNVALLSTYDKGAVDMFESVASAFENTWRIS